MNCSTPGFPVHHQLLKLAQTHVHRISDAIRSSHPLFSLLLLLSIFPRIRVFSSESALHIRWPKYWSFSFSISPSNEYSVLISFRIDLNFLLSNGLSRIFCSTTVRKHQFFGAQVYGPKKPMPLFGDKGLNLSCPELVLSLGITLSQRFETISSCS